MSSKVYFTDLHVSPPQNLQGKMGHLVHAAGIETIDFKNKFAAIKIHFGEAGNLAYIPHNYAARMVEIVQALGAKAFLTDCSTLYTGRRSNAIDHVIAASENGYNLLSVKAPVIIGDGLLGTDYKEIPTGMPHCRSAKIGSVIADADILISMTHFKGHEMTGFGGALKNIGMGAASKGGKLELHATSQPQIETKNCTGCKLCAKHCNYGAISVGANRKAYIDADKCVGCGQCIAMCRFGAAQPVWDGSADLMNKKIAEYTHAALLDKQHFHVSFIIKVSPDCDCWGCNDMPLVPDLGIAASFDPVALDKCCVDLVTAAPALYSPRLDGSRQPQNLAGVDKFGIVHPNTDWAAGLRYAESIGLGSMDYEMVTV
jgi:uncharacterized Fe-S center protein